MMETTIETATNEEFDKIINQHIAWAAEWDGALPADVFFGVWADLQRERKPLEVTVRLVDDELKLNVLANSALKLVNNHLYLEDGRELVIHLETV